jgi:hypothetical protein
MESGFRHCNPPCSLLQIILLLSDLSFVDMTTNLVLNLQALGMEHYLVVATEAEVCVRFAREGIVTGCAVSSVLSSLPQSVWTTWDLPNQGKANLHLLWWQVRVPYAFFSQHPRASNRPTLCRLGLDC